MLPKKSLGLRMLVTLILIVGYYVLALAVAAFLALAACLLPSPYIIAVCIVTVIIILWSILPRWGKFIAPGPELSSDDHPRLFNEIEYIAKELNEKVPEKVYVALDVNAGVAQVGGFGGIGSRRILIIGLPLFQSLTPLQLRAILCHEFGHYYNGDTKLGGLTYRGRKAIERTVINLSRHSAVWTDFFSTYHKLFLRITSSTSRAQEVNADMLSAKLAGGKNTADALSTVYGTSETLKPYWNEVIIPILESGCKPSLLKLYGEFLNSPFGKENVEKTLKNELSTTRPHRFDSHPTLKNRLEYLKNSFQFDTMASVETNLTAATLLGDVSKVETALLSQLLGSDEVKKLRYIDWTNLEEGYVSVWKVGLTKYAAALKEITAEKLPYIYPESYSFQVNVEKCYGEKVDLEPLKTLCNLVIGQAIALLLYNKGWVPHIAPGSSLVMKKDDKEVRPFLVYYNMSNGFLKQDKWAERCAEIGITGVDLGDVLYM